MANNWCLKPTKSLFLVNLRTLRYLSKYTFKRKYNDILEIDFANKYTVENRY
jgi:hypothetical protein